ncbi:putative protein kinase [Aspergillus fijiensis CBS 313.89]|uniref:non-specific serine/threonine protein kinase n=1 Tax=Aspergillus fijiensis CBS 313.89 TaxID=1448319 RepID=A0A8G1VU83_9EURO|nr:kinase-like protein [Aspergillus fijiensis CBS 313.89]RAK71838.1 kinase-like protein [Aspergillus fijiensis CBS 313.89]
MKRAGRIAWTNVCLPGARRCFAKSLPSTSCCRRTSLQSALGTTAVLRRTVISSAQWTCTPRVFPTSGVKLLDQSAELDEETLPNYQPEKYYLVTQGEVLNDRYQTLAKLGYGVTSTVWLAKDLVASTYVVLKVYVTGQNRDLERELDIYKRINSLLNYFHLQGPHGCHACLVHEPLGMTADFLARMAPRNEKTLDFMKPAIRQLLVALDFLHSECHIIHTDRTIYKSLGFLSPGGLPILADFGEARFGDKKQNGDIMPNVYRAPEVILRSCWDYKVDIWNIAMVVNIVSSRTLINGKNPDGIFDDRVHIAELIALLGPPTPEFREQRHLSSAFWDKSGKWKEVASIPDITLESLASEVEGEGKEGFFQWLRMALQWNPDDRATALELLFDEWMMKGL